MMMRDIRCYATLPPIAHAAAMRCLRLLRCMLLLLYDDAAAVARPYAMRRRLRY